MRIVFTRLMIIGAIVFGFTQSVAAQLFVQTFGDRSHPAVVFLHGGPGYNSASFEFAVAQDLANRGLFVVCFDQRGCGRSQSIGGRYTFQEATSDIDSILKSLSISRAAFIAHSFGGVVAMQYAAAKPQHVSAIVFVGAPFNMGEMLRVVQNNCLQRFQQRQDSASIRTLRTVAAMDSSSIMYSSSTFMLAMKAGCYNVPMPTAEANEVKAVLRAHPSAKQWMSNMTMPPVAGFLNNERYTTTDYTALAKTIRPTVPMIGLYGEHDGLFDAASIRRIADVIGADRVETVPMASHSVFLDQKSWFIDKVATFVTTLPSRP